ncbi:hypothetical protein CYMTET_21633, partial [Cymbomonas tetramitiformis]
FGLLIAPGGIAGAFGLVVREEDRALGAVGCQIAFITVENSDGAYASRGMAAGAQLYGINLRCELHYTPGDVATLRTALETLASECKVKLVVFFVDVPGVFDFFREASSAGLTQSNNMTFMTTGHEQITNSFHSMSDAESKQLSLWMQGVQVLQPSATQSSPNVTDSLAMLADLKAAWRNEINISTLPEVLRGKLGDDVDDFLSADFDDGEMEGFCAMYAAVWNMAIAASHTWRDLSASDWRDRPSRSDRIYRRLTTGLRDLKVVGVASEFNTLGLLKLNVSWARLYWNSTMSHWKRVAWYNASSRTVGEIQSAAHYGAGTSVNPCQGCAQPGTVYMEELLRCGFQGALFMENWDVYDTNSRMAVAAYIALDHVNRRDPLIVADAEILHPDFGMGLGLFNDENDIVIGTEAMLEAVNEGARVLIGPQTSDVAEPQGVLGGVYDVPIISNSATAEELTELALFSRLILTDTWTVQALLNLIVSNTWSQIGLIHPTGTWGDGFNLLLSEQVGWYDVELLITKSFSKTNSPEELREALWAVKASSARIIVLLLPGGINATAFFGYADTIGLIGNGYVWILPESINFSTELADPANGAELARLLEGLLTIKQIGGIPDKLSLLDIAFKGASISILPPEMQARPDLFTPEFFAEGLGGTSSSGYVYDAVWTAAFALHSTFQGNHSDEHYLSMTIKEKDAEESQMQKSLFSSILSTSFSGMLNVSFTKEGNREPATGLFILENYQSGEPVLVKMASPESDWIDVEGATITYSSNSTIPPEDGTLCTAGTYFNVDVVGCDLCPPGTYTDGHDVQHACTECHPGSYGPAYGLDVCLKCPSLEYQPDYGSTECLECPAGAAGAASHPRPAAPYAPPITSGTEGLGSGSTELQNCTCVEGFYRSDGQLGMPCFECPDGGNCTGGTALPFALDGYWGDWDTVPPEDTLDEAGASRIQYLVYHQCPTRTQDRCNGEGRCAGTNLTYQECRSEVENLCGTMFDGAMCDACSLEHFNFGGQCFKCPTSGFTLSNIVFVTAGIVAVAASWIILNKYCAGEYDSIDITLLFLQIASICSQFQLGWPSGLDHIFLILTLVNFDVDVFRPDCLNTETYTAWSYYHTFLLQNILPPFIAGMNFAFYGINWLLVRSNRTHAKGEAETPHNPGLMHRLWRWTRLPLDYLRKISAKDHEELKWVLDRAICESLTFLIISYHTLTINALSVFFCTELPDGNYFLNVSPDITCYESDHVMFMVMAIFAVIFYTVGVPGFFGVILHQGKENDLFANPHYAARFGMLYRRYEKGWYWWEVCLLMRRLAFCIILTMVENQLLQATTSIVILVLFIALHYYARPFLEDDIDMLECTSLIALICLLATGISFNDTETHNEYARMLLIFALLTFGANIFAVTCITIKDIIGKRKTSISTLKLEDLMKWVSRRPGLGEDAKMEFSGKRVRDLELLSTLSRDDLHTWVDAVYHLAIDDDEDPGDSGDPNVEEDPAKKDDEHREELPVTLLRTLFTSEDLLSKVVPDDSIMSYFSEHPLASFMTNLAKEMPEIFDLAVASPNKRDELCGIVKQLFNLHMVMKGQTGPAALVHFVDRGPLLFWLLTTDRASAAHVCSLLQSVQSSYRLPYSQWLANSAQGVIDQAKDGLRSVSSLDGPKLSSLLSQSMSAMRGRIEERARALKESMDASGFIGLQYAVDTTQSAFRLPTVIRRGLRKVAKLTGIVRLGEMHSKGAPSRTSGLDMGIWFT